MLSRERLLTSLNHQQADKIPIDFGSTAVTGIHVIAVEKLRRHFALEKRPVRVNEPYQMLGEVEEDLQEAMGVDVAGLYSRNTMFGFPLLDWKEWQAPWGQDLLVPGNFHTAPDAKGGLLIYPEGDRTVPASGHMPAASYFFDAIIRQEPLDEARLNSEDNLEEFKPVSEEELAYIRQEVMRLSGSGRAIIANFGGTAFGDIALVPAPFLKKPKGIRDISEWYMSTIMRQDYIHEIFKKQAEIAIQNLAKIFEVVGNRIDVVFICGTDFGTQTSSFCSPETFDSLYLPYYQKVNNWIHKHTTWKTFKHSCGAVENFMDHFIEAGFDIINPVQCTAKDMDSWKLKSKYGDKLTFWGGGADTQGALSLGTAQEVHAQVIARCEVFSKGGGYVFNTVHNIQATTPIENLVSMLEALQQINA
jgi:uroporphyrinogen-III decarboxylase